MTMVGVQPSAGRAVCDPLGDQCLWACRASVNRFPRVKMVSGVCSVFYYVHGIKGTTLK